MKEEEIKYKIELLCSKYEIETLEPNEIIKDWFKDFENDMMYIFNEGQLQAKEDFLKMIEELTEETDAGDLGYTPKKIVYVNELKQRLQEKNKNI